MKDKTIQMEDNTDYKNIQLRCPTCDENFTDFNEAALHIVKHHTMSEGEQLDFIMEALAKSTVKQITYAYIKGVCIGIIMSILFLWGRSLV